MGKGLNAAGYDFISKIPLLKSSIFQQIFTSILPGKHQLDTETLKSFEKVLDKTPGMKSFKMTVYEVVAEMIHTQNLIGPIVAMLSPLPTGTGKILSIPAAY